MENLKALTIKEADGSVINLKNIGNAGATALIPKPVFYSPGRDHVDVDINGKTVVEYVQVEETSAGDLYVFVPKSVLLDLSGTTGNKFKYLYFDNVGNPHDSDNATYDIYLAK